ncbi:carbamoyltransferase C-terminal domain-containing protein [Streptomyces sp. NPDC001107]
MGDTYVLGISMSSHDRAAALLRNGRIVAAVAEERIDRRKKSQGFYAHTGGKTVLPPLAAVTYVLREAGLRLDDVHLVVCGRSITTCREAVLGYLPLDPDRVVEPGVPAHHLGHAYSAYATSPFDACDVLVIDEQGHHLPDGSYERATWFSGDLGPLQVERRFLGHGGELSLGMYFDAFAALTGLSEAGLPAAGKLMALAAHGERRADWPSLTEHLADGDVRIRLGAIDAFLEEIAHPVAEGYAGWVPARLDDLRLKYRPIHWGTQLAADLARKVQDDLEAAVIHTASTLRERTGRANLAYAGGVALNCTANARLREAGYQDVFVHPAATDDGIAVGLAMYGWIDVLGHRREPVKKFSAFLGAHPSKREATTALEDFGLSSYGRNAEVTDVALLLSQDKIVCWYTGRSEWGPRALGARSILADPTSPGSVERLNSRVKFREPFRPFGVSVDEDAAAELFDLELQPPSLGPYMLSVAEVVEPRLKHIAHRDGTVRYQTVPRAAEHYHRLLVEMRQYIGVPAVLNTSFNTGGEPLVETPQDAVRQFLVSGADALYLEGTLLELSDVPAEVRERAVGKAQGADAVGRLKQALQQEAAGYPDAARAIASGVNLGLEHGPQNLREHAALLMRLADDARQFDEASRRATEVLSWSGMPAAASEAASLLARPTSSDSPLSEPAARFLKALAGQGRAIPVLQKVFAAAPTHENTGGRP